MTVHTNNSTSDPNLCLNHSSIQWSWKTPTWGAEQQFLKDGTNPIWIDRGRKSRLFGSAHRIWVSVPKEGIQHHIWRWDCPYKGMLKKIKWRPELNSNYHRNVRGTGRSRWYEPFGSIWRAYIAKSHTAKHIINGKKEVRFHPCQNKFSTYHTKCNRRAFVTEL